jgi:hypothetical protein
VVVVDDVRGVRFGEVPDTHEEVCRRLFLLRKRAGRLQNGGEVVGHLAYLAVHLEVTCPL